MTQDESLILVNETLSDLHGRDSGELSAVEARVLIHVGIADGPHTLRSLTDQLRLRRGEAGRAVFNLMDVGLADKIPTGAPKSYEVLPTAQGLAFLTILSDRMESAEARGGLRLA
jgi:hypothetical protein